MDCQWRQTLSAQRKNSGIMMESFPWRQITHYGLHLVVPVFIANKNELIKTKDDVILPTNIDTSKKYFGYRSSDDSMLPLLGTGDIAIVEKINTFKSGQTCLISLDNNSIIIRKIIDFKEYIELHTAFPYGQPVKLTKEDIKIRNFIILGKIIKAENESAFK